MAIVSQQTSMVIFTELQTVNHIHLMWRYLSFTVKPFYSHCELMSLILVNGEWTDCSLLFSITAKKPSLEDLFTYRTFRQAVKIVATPFHPGYNPYEMILSIRTKASHHKKIASFAFLLDCWTGTITSCPHTDWHQYVISSMISHTTKCST